MKKSLFACALLAVLLPLGAGAQQQLSLEDCRALAVENNKELAQARTQVEMAGYDRKIAFANYLPNISATGVYLHNTRDLSLLDRETSSGLRNMGTAAQTYKDGLVGQLQQLIQSNPQLAAVYSGSPEVQQLVAKLAGADVSAALNGIGSTINDAFTIDIANIYAGVVSLQQPLFMGGKIVAANRIASLAEELSRSQYDAKYQDLILTVDQAYWQIVSLAAKMELAEAYADLLHKMEKDVDVAIKEGVSTASDGLQIKVKANEADMLLTKATNGLTLSKMLLCKETGLPLDSEIRLADEGSDPAPAEVRLSGKGMEDIYADRPELRSLRTAEKIYDGKVAVARADMMPKVALLANYLVTNPNMYHSYQHDFAGMVNFGVMVNVPIFHGFEALNKTRKAKAEASLYADKLTDAQEMVSLQVTQLRKTVAEATEKLRMAESNLANAEENLRIATIGFEEGVTTTNTALAAQTAWLQAHSEYIDAGIELRMTLASLDKAEGNIVSE